MSSKARILVVDDDTDLALCMQLQLNEFDYSVTAIALTGEEAIQKAGETRPDLVLMDIRLRGDMDGVEAARIIGERFDIPVIFVTAHSDEASVERAKRAEPYGYILKPFQHGRFTFAWNWLCPGTSKLKVPRTSCALWPPGWSPFAKTNENELRVIFMTNLARR